MISPCKSCNKKGCGPYHDQCEEYKAYKEKCESLNNAERKAKNKPCKSIDIKRATFKSRANNVFKSPKY